MKVLKSSSPAGRAEVRAPRNPFLTDVQEQVREAGRILGKSPQEIADILQPEHIYAKWLTSKTLTSGRQERFLVVRVQHRRPIGEDGRPERAQGGIRIVLPEMLGPGPDDLHSPPSAFYQAVPQLEPYLTGDLQTDENILNRFLTNWIVDEAIALATGMSFKNKVAGLPLGGGKGVILLAHWENLDGKWTLVPINDGKFEVKDLALLMRDAARAFAEDGIIYETIDGGAPDVNPFKHLVSTSQMMGWLVDETLEYLMELPRHPLWQKEPKLLKELTAADNSLIQTPYLDAAFAYTTREGRPVPEISRYTGKKVGQGGSLYRDKSTGEGTVMAAEALVRKLYPERAASPRPLEGMRVAIQGFGNAAIYAAYRLVRQGAKILAISDSGGAILKTKGGYFSEEELGKLVRLKEGTAEKKSVIDAVRARNGNYQVKETRILGKKAVGNAKLLELDVDLLIPAALENQINEENANRIRAQIVSEAANGATTKGSIERLFERPGNKKTYVIPFILASAGGVAISSKEVEQNLSSHYLSEDELRRWLETRMQSAVDAVWQVHQERKVDLGTAAFLVGMERLTRKPPVVKPRSEVRTEGRDALSLVLTTLKQSQKFLNRYFRRSENRLQGPTIDFSMVRNNQGRAKRMPQFDVTSLLTYFDVSLALQGGYDLTARKKRGFGHTTGRELGLGDFWRALLPSDRARDRAQWLPGYFPGLLALSSLARRNPEEKEPMQQDNRLLLSQEQLLSSSRSTSTQKSNAKELESQGTSRAEVRGEKKRGRRKNKPAELKRQSSGWVTYSSTLTSPFDEGKITLSPNEQLVKDKAIRGLRPEAPVLRTALSGLEPETYPFVKGSLSPLSYRAASEIRGSISRFSHIVNNYIIKNQSVPTPSRAEVRSNIEVKGWRNRDSGTTVIEIKGPGIKEKIDAGTVKQLVQGLNQAFANIGVKPEEARAIEGTGENLFYIEYTHPDGIKARRPLQMLEEGKLVEVLKEIFSSRAEVRATGFSSEEHRRELELDITRVIETVEESNIGGSERRQILEDLNRALNKVKQGVFPGLEGDLVQVYQAIDRIPQKSLPTISETRIAVQDLLTEVRRLTNPSARQPRGGRKSREDRPELRSFNIDIRRAELRRVPRTVETPLEWEVQFGKALREVKAKILGRGRAYAAARWVAVHIADGFFLPVPAQLLPRVRAFLEADILYPFSVPARPGSSQAALDILLLKDLPAENDPFYFGIAQNLYRDSNRFVVTMLVGGDPQVAQARNQAFRNDYRQYPGLGQRFKILISQDRDLHQTIQRAIDAVHKEAKKQKTTQVGTMAEFFDHVTISSSDFGLLSGVLAPTWRIQDDLENHRAGAQAHRIRRELDLGQELLPAEKIKQLRELKSKIISAAKGLLSDEDLSLISEAFDRAWASRTFAWSA